MHQASDESDAVIAFIVRNMVCDHCGAPYTPGDIQVVLHDDVQCVLNATCGGCKTDRTVTAYAAPPYHQLQRVVPLVPREITPQDCTEWCAFLASFDGDLIDLLCEP